MKLGKSINKYSREIKKKIHRNYFTEFMKLCKSINKYTREKKENRKLLYL